MFEFCFIFIGSSQSIKHNQHCKGNNKPVSHTSKHSLCGAAVIRSSRVFMSVNLHSRHFCRFSFLASNKLNFINILKAKSTKLTILQRFPFTHMLILMPSEWNVFNIVCASHSLVFPFHRSAPSRSLHVSDWSDALTRLSERWRTDPGWLIKLLTTFMHPLNLTDDLRFNEATLRKVILRLLNLPELQASRDEQVKDEQVCE